MSETKFLRLDRIISNQANAGNRRYAAIPDRNQPASCSADVNEYPPCAFIA